MGSEDPPFPVDASATAVLQRLWAASHSAYLVGGGVRDALLGLEVSDWDVATDARPDRILAIFPGSTYENRFGTVLADGIEITTFRRDHHYADHRRPDRVVFSDDIGEDLRRRDLTINAIAWGRHEPGAKAGIEDPTDGQDDLRAGIVRAVGDPSQRFDEDALRLLRAIRIAARLDFTIEPATWDAIVAHADDVRYVSPERVAGEVRRVLGAPRPSAAMRMLDASTIQGRILPEFDRLKGETVDDALATLDRVVAERPGHETLALAALLMPLHPDHVIDVLARLRVAVRDRGAVTALVHGASLSYEPAWSDADVRRAMIRVPGTLLDDLLVLRGAGAHGDPAAERREAELARRMETQRSSSPPLTLAGLAIDGRDLRGALELPEGPAIGVILRRLLDDVIEDPRRNTRTTLLARATELLDDLPSVR